MKLRYCLILLYISNSFSLNKRQSFKHGVGDIENKRIYHVTELMFENNFGYSSERKSAQGYPRVIETTPDYYSDHIEPLMKPQKKIKKRKNVFKVGATTTESYAHFIETEPIDDKYFYKDPILNIYNKEGRRKFIHEKSGNAPNKHNSGADHDISNNSAEESESERFKDLWGEKCYNHPPSICVFLNQCNKNDLTPRGNTLCHENGKELICCHIEARDKKNEPRGLSAISENLLGKKCGTIPHAVCVVPKSCAWYSEIPQGKIFCNKEGRKDLVCCKEDTKNHSRQKYIAKIKCSNRPPSICVTPDACHRNDRQEQGHHFCQKDGSKKVCCTEDKVKGAISEAYNLVKCSNTPPSACVFKEDCIKNDLQPQGHHFCKNENKNMVCCRHEMIKAPDADNLVKCSNTPPSACIFKEDCVKNDLQPQGHHFCKNENKNMVCCRHEMIKAPDADDLVKCSNTPPSACIFKEDCVKNDLQPQGHHFCKNENKNMVCCRHEMIKTPDADNLVKCSNTPPSACVFKEYCVKNDLQPQGHHFCKNKNKNMVCCRHEIKMEPDAPIKCSLRPLSICVATQSCNTKYWQPQGHHFCTKDGMNMVCCAADKVGTELTRPVKKCSNKAPSVCVSADKCSIEDRLPQGHHFCQQQSIQMVCCTEQGALKNNVWGTQCLNKPLSICVFPKECSSKYKSTEGNFLCKGDEKMICCNFYNFAYVWSLLIEGKKARDIVTPIKASILKVPAGEWGTRCSHKPKSICVFKRQCTDKYYSLQGHNFCGSQNRTMVCCDIYNYLWEMLFDSEKVENKGKDKQGVALGKWGEPCSDHPESICVTNSECHKEYRFYVGDHICDKMICCQFYKQLWNILISNKVSDSDSDETTTIKTTLAIQHSAIKSQWGVRCSLNPKSICVLPTQCAKEFITRTGQSFCKKGPVTMICCDFIKHIWKVFVDHGDLKNLNDYEGMLKIPHQYPLSYRKQIESRPSKSGIINLNGSMIQIHEVSVKKIRKEDDGRRQSQYRSIYLPNGDLLWKVKGIRGKYEDKNITDMAYYSIKNALSNLLDPNKTNEVLFRNHLPALKKYFKSNSHLIDSTSDMSYDSQGIYNEDLYDPTLSLGLSDSVSVPSKIRQNFNKWGDICSHDPQSVCMLKKQCNKKSRTPQGHHFCNQTSQDIVCCNVYEVWKLIFDSNNTKFIVPQKQISKHWGKTCSKSPNSICVLSSQCSTNYQSPQGQHFCPQDVVELACCDIYYLWESSVKKWTSKTFTLNTIGKWGKRCSRSDSVCVSESECIPLFEKPQGHHFCKNDYQKLICCDYIEFLWTVLIEHGEYPSKSKPTKYIEGINDIDKWGLRCSNNPPSICVLKSQCTKTYRNRRGNHFCRGKDKLVCCDFISHLYDTLIVNGGWNIARDVFEEFVFNLLKAEIDDDVVKRTSNNNKALRQAENLTNFKGRRHKDDMKEICVV